MGLKMARRYNSIDKHIAGRIKERRKQLSISQTTLGDALGVTFQQVQKIEGGDNRIGAGNLWKAAKVLNKPVQWFYEGL